MNRLPPLNSLRAFECTARYLSFSKAAQHLNVTPGAISQQVKQLEDFLNIRLFDRQNRTIALTRAGLIFYPQLSEGFKYLSNAVETLRIHDEDEPLTVTAPPSFVSKWLIPRLCDFNQKHPDINVRIDSSTRLVDFDQESIDLGIRFNMESDPILDSTFLMSLNAVAVCSPGLIVSENKCLELSALKNYTLLHFDDSQFAQDWPDWAMWLATAGIQDINPTKGMYFSQLDMLMEAAIEGQGIALITDVVADKDLKKGTLIKPFDISVPVNFSYFLVTSKAKALKKNVSVFKRWINEQVN